MQAPQPDPHSIPSGRLALVTGGHGFLGSHLVDLLLAQGWRVRCLLRPSRDVSVFEGRAVEVARGDLRSYEGLREATHEVDTVFHVAGKIAALSPRGFDEVNVAGTARLARVLEESAAGATSPRRRLVLVSSQAAAGPSLDGHPISESQTPAPVSAYGMSKLRGEHALKGHLRSVPWTIVRPPAIYGPRDEAILPFFQLGARGWAPGLDGRGRRFNLLHARDVAAGLLAAAESPAAAGRTYFLADAVRGYRYADLARALETIFHKKMRRLPIPDMVLDLAGALTDEVAALTRQAQVFGRHKARELKVRWWLASPDAARQDLGWVPKIDLAQGFGETARWYGQEGKIPPLDAKPNRPEQGRAG